MMMMMMMVCGDDDDDDDDDDNDDDDDDDGQNTCVYLGDQYRRYRTKYPPLSAARIFV